jgi:NADH:ubiquinone oxidoreductase subunit E
MPEVETTVEKERIDQILEEYDDFEGNLISILHEVQGVYNYLPEEALVLVAKATGFSLQRVFSIATFYNFFSLDPRGKHLVHICMGTACHVQGAARVLDEFQERLGIREGETTPDMQFTLSAVRCIGACSLAPVVIIGDETHATIKPKKVEKLLKRYQAPVDPEGISPV